MAMKQTQTKLFDFSDVGLDFCAGSKSLFPDRFKKMLSLGYNEQIVSSVSVSGDQVTFNYGVSHGYVADRVLNVNAPELLNINGGEFVINSVTENTVTLTVEGAPSLINGNFTTRIAPLGWDLVFEKSNIHVYQIKTLDENDLYVRLCFQNNSNLRNRISPCVGKSYDSATGEITDLDAIQANTNTATPSTFAWDFNYQANSSYNNFTAAQGAGFGKGVLIGSKYHICIFTNSAQSTYSAAGYIGAILPTTCLDYEVLKAPIIIGSNQPVSGDGSVRYLDSSAAYINNIPVKIQGAIGESGIAPRTPFSQNSFLPITIDAFNTTPAYPMPIHELTTGGFLGYGVGLFLASYGSNNAPPTTMSSIPFYTYDIDLTSKSYIHQVDRNSPNGGVWFCVPVEEIKID
ncbi:hypothetical protein AMD27_08275 [Acinetobacter sp. TGL-Y2]|uniref:hypothetical protein n=1 Tax=Acinetobacter sp. TGL-Y2 TaxID=1407071 RepID=UPI0007A649E2|nr:hypothetical protein [Acinetobacter sp. TGL-Y2]AMW78872.1 hypothetical protein AMD27_08275 [Acinetobacter sp. TGL-Y2]